MANHRFRKMDLAFFVFLSRYFWLVGLGVNGINAAIFRARSQAYIRQNPALAPGYNTLIRGFLICSSLPFLTMGFGILVGDVPTIWHFLYPYAGNPYVLVWWAVYWLTLAFLTHWVVLRGGAEMLISHPGLMRGNPKNPKMVKLFWLFMLAASTTFTVLVFHQSTSPIPPELYELG